MEKNIQACFLDQTDSSNDQAKGRAFQNSEPVSVFLAGRQSKGRGRGKAKWEDSDLMISFLWTKNVQKISLKSCESFSKDLQKALKAVWPELPVRVQAPNDLYLDKGKVAGILLEPLRQGPQTALVVGLGLNVFSCPRHLPADRLAGHTDNINPETWGLFLEKLFSLWNQRACHSHFVRMA